MRSYIALIVILVIFTNLIVPNDYQVTDDLETVNLMSEFGSDWDYVLIVNTPMDCDDELRKICNDAIDKYNNTIPIGDYITMTVLVFYKNNNISFVRGYNYKNTGRVVYCETLPEMNNIPKGGFYAYPTSTFTIYHQNGYTYAVLN